MKIGVSNKWTDKENEAMKPIIQYRHMVKDYNACKDIYESLYPSITSKLRDVVVSSSGGNSMEDKMVSILDHRAHCLADLHKQMAVLTRIEQSVDSLPVDEKLIIRKFYMSEQRVSMEDIAEEIRTSVESCWRWRRKAIARLVQKLTVNDSET